MFELIHLCSRPFTSRIFIWSCMIPFNFHPTVRLFKASSPNILFCVHQTSVVFMKNYKAWLSFFSSLQCFQEFSDIACCSSCTHHHICCTPWRRLIGILACQKRSDLLKAMYTLLYSYYHLQHLCGVPVLQQTGYPCVSAPSAPLLSVQIPNNDCISINSAIIPLTPYQRHLLCTRYRNQAVLNHYLCYFISKMPSACNCNHLMARFNLPLSLYTYCISINNTHNYMWDPIW